ncbi:hypothetical protein GQ600_9442 [Phytophthora cactorum]|nr:hypothetical protein GQ600_9442 [Phytophthora cactorum]
MWRPNDSNELSFCAPISVSRVRSAHPPSSQEGPFREHPAALYTSRQERLVCILTEDVFGSIKRATIHTGKGPAGLARAPCAQDGLNTRTALVRMLSQSSSTVAGF